MHPQYRLEKKVGVAIQNLNSVVPRKRFKKEVLKENVMGTKKVRFVNNVTYFTYTEKNKKVTENGVIGHSNTPVSDTGTSDDIRVV